MKLHSLFALTFVRVISLMIVASLSNAQEPVTATASGETVQVAPATGKTETDRKNVQAAFDAVKPGGVVQFPSGTYLLGEGAMLTVPDVTVLGHADGTVLRGCEPESFRLPDGFGMEEVMKVASGCTGFFILADQQTVRGLIFEHTWHGLFIGMAPWLAQQGEGGISASGSGGHLIEKNIFRNVPNGIRVVGPSERVTVIRQNEVDNAYHALHSNGAPVHIIDNRITVSKPETVPTAYYPESGVILSVSPPGTVCKGSRVEGNDITGTIHGIQILSVPGMECSDHEIRNNVIRVREVPLPPGYSNYYFRFYFGKDAVGSTVTGIAIRLYGGLNPSGPGGGGESAAASGTVTGVVVKDNRVIGGVGLGMQLVNASGNRIEGNHFSDIRVRTPFPGLTWGDETLLWRGANGSGIWISPGSDENVITGNTFERIAANAVFLEGDKNVVEIRSRADRVRNSGKANQVRRISRPAPR